MENDFEVSTCDVPISEFHPKCGRRKSILKYQLVMFQFLSSAREVKGGKRILKISTLGVLISEFRLEGGRRPF